MVVFRIVKNRTRTSDLSGKGAYLAGGRWNSEGTYMLYTSANSSLALLENLVHFDVADMPPHLYLMHIEIDDRAPVYILPDKEYPSDWLGLELFENKVIGDRFASEAAYLALKVRSAVNPLEFNFLLNPLFPRYHDLVKVIQVEELPFDQRLLK